MARLGRGPKGERRGALPVFPGDRTSRGRAAAQSALRSGEACRDASSGHGDERTEVMQRLASPGGSFSRRLVSRGAIGALVAAGMLAAIPVTLAQEIAPPLSLEAVARTSVV